MLSGNIDEYTNYIGKSGLFWFLGVVIDRQDPLKKGRVRVRIYAHYTNDLTLIDHDQTHWCDVMGTPLSAASSGLGHSPTGLVPGSTVVGIFFDHDHQQEGLVIGTLYGLPIQNAKTAAPFSDPRDYSKLFEKLASAPRKILSYSYKYDGSGITFNPESQAQNYPRESNPNDVVLSDHNDISNLATGTNLSKTIIGIKQNSLDQNVNGAFGNTWSEPTVSDAPVYPYNQVYQSESGTYLEYDSTPNAERTSFFDRSGSWWTYYPNGIFVEKFGNDVYSIKCKDVYEHLCGTENKTIGRDSNELVQGSKNLEINDNLQIRIHQNGMIEIDGNAIITVKGDATVSISGTLSASANTINITSSGDLNLTATGQVNIKGTKINLN